LDTELGYFPFYTTGKRVSTHGQNANKLPKLFKHGICRLSFVMSDFLPKNLETVKNKTKQHAGKCELLLSTPWSASNPLRHRSFFIIGK
jgi:hypothetical protein